MRALCNVPYGFAPVCVCVRALCNVQSGFATVCVCVRAACAGVLQPSIGGHHRPVDNQAGWPAQQLLLPSELVELASSEWSKWSELKRCRATRWTLRVRAMGEPAVAATQAMGLGTATMGERTNFVRKKTHLGSWSHKCWAGIFLQVLYLRAKLCNDKCWAAINHDQSTTAVLMEEQILKESIFYGPRLHWDTFLATYQTQKKTYVWICFPW